MTLGCFGGVTLGRLLGGVILGRLLGGVTLGRLLGGATLGRLLGGATLGLGTLGLVCAWATFCHLYHLYLHHILNLQRLSRREVLLQTVIISESFHLLLSLESCLTDY